MDYQGSPKYKQILDLGLRTASVDFRIYDGKSKRDSEVARTRRWV